MKHVVPTIVINSKLDISSTFEVDSGVVKTRCCNWMCNARCVNGNVVSVWVEFILEGVKLYG